MEIDARLVAELPPPGALVEPLVPGPPGRRLATARTDTALTVLDLDDGTTVVTFPAPWPRAAGGVDAVAPGLGLAVFAGLHALRAVTPDGGCRWELRHTCWDCEEEHDEPDPDHRCSDSGSAAFDTGGDTVWAHVRTRAQDDDEDDDESPEEWLVLDAATGAVRARAGTGTWAAGSHHIPHPEPGVMGLSVGEGQDGAPALWGRLRDGELTVDRLPGDDEVLVATGPGGRTFLTVGHARPRELTVWDRPEHRVRGVLLADALPGAEPGDCWDFRCGPVDDRTVVASTSDKGHGRDRVRHWLIDVPALEIRGPVRAAAEAAANPRGLGDGTWITQGPAGVRRWVRSG